MMLQANNVQPKINDLIFNELVDVNPNDLQLDQDERFLGEGESLYNDLVARENDFIDFDDLDEYVQNKADRDNDDYDDLMDEYFDTEIINVQMIPHNSLLMSLLCTYFHNVDGILEHARSSVETSNHDILFVTGMGYDIISSDLLGGQPDGQAQQKFLAWCNGQTLESQK